MRILVILAVSMAFVVSGNIGVSAELGTPGEQVAASVDVPASKNIWKRTDRSKRSTEEERAARLRRLSEDDVDSNATEAMHFWLYLPEDYADKKKCPLILFLHGAGERGDDLELVKKHGPPKLVLERSDCPAIVVSPQCPVERYWSAARLSVLLDHCMETLKVDADRVYVTGLSMGGYGTWSLAAKEPERFAAAVPICGGGNVETADRLVDLPIWVFHGEKDTTVKPEKSEEMVRAIRAAGGKKAKLTMYPDAGHDSWTKTYANDDVAEWLLEQKRGK